MRRALNHGEIIAMSRALAHHLRNAHASSVRSVAIAMRTIPSGSCLWATVSIGAAVVGMTRGDESEMEYGLADSRPRC